MNPDDRGRAANEDGNEAVKAAGGASDDAKQSGTFVGGAVGKPSEGGTGSGGKGSESTEAHAFERWLTHKLNQVYDELLTRPVPEGLLRLIERHRRKKSQ